VGTLDQHLFALEPQYRERVWGGRRLRAAKPPVGEAWVACGPSVVASGPSAGLTLEGLAASHGPTLLGTDVSHRYGTRFPLLAKLLDCADWLSIQVHPNDEQARRLVGPGEFGKTEAWYFLGAEAGARSMVGVKSGVGHSELVAAIREGRILEIAKPLAVRQGEALLIPSGTLHGLGPGILLYELQQASDTTYRVYDWGRPASAGRKLHLKESAEVALPVGPTELRHPQVSGETGTAPVIGCEYFDLDLIRVSSGGGPLSADTAGRSFHVLTVIEGTARVSCGSERIDLSPFATALVAGSSGAYEIAAKDGPASLLRATVPAEAEDRSSLGATT
jgi:mannose-6-phosphate isomerase